MTLQTDLRTEGGVGVSQYPNFFFEKHGDNDLLNLL